MIFKKHIGKTRTLAMYSTTSLIFRGYPVMMKAPVTAVFDKILKNISNALYAGTAFGS